MFFNPMRTGEGAGGGVESTPPYGFFPFTQKKF